jgi:hypothetical protein
MILDLTFSQLLITNQMTIWKKVNSQFIDQVFKNFRKGLPVTNGYGAKSTEDYYFNTLNDYALCSSRGI